MPSTYRHVTNHPNLLYYVDRRTAYEHTCYGCQQPLPGELTWSEANQRYMFGAMLRGPFVAVITDRSGSEQATAHNNPTCIEQAAEKLTTEDADYE